MSALAQPAPIYDIVIRNGHLLDGDGNPWVNADVAIKDGRFVKIGRVEGRGAREIDARGDYVSPGWIDMMDQSGEVLLKNGLAENKLREGVTSAIAGEGGTPVPSAQIADYFKKLETQGISLNFGTYYGSGQARVEVMGDVAGHPTPQQLDAMKAHVDEAMRAGAMGIATALIYPPDSFQSTEDLIELSRVAAKYGGIYASHMRDESAKLLQAIGESIEIGEKTGIQVEIFHFKGAYAPGWGKLVPQAGELIECGARARREHRGRHVCLYRGRHGPRHHGAELGLGAGREEGSGTTQGSAGACTPQEGGRGRFGAGMVQPGSRPAAAGITLCSPMPSIRSTTNIASRASSTSPSNCIRIPPTYRGISCSARSRTAPWDFIS